MRKIGAYKRDSTSAAVPLGSVPLLDTEGLGSALAAYSFRKLRSAYAGDCIRIRRVNDNAEANIGFDADGWVDKAAVSAHCTTNDGRIVTFYDQAGSNNMISTDSSRQMKLWDGITENWIGQIANRPCGMPQANNAVYLTSDPNVFPIDTTTVSVCGITGSQGATAPPQILRTLLTNAGLLGSLFFPAFGFDAEIHYNSEGTTYVTSDFVTGVTNTINTSYVIGFAATHGTPATYGVRAYGNTFTTTSLTPLRASNTTIVIGGNTRMPSALHTFQEAVWYNRDIGETGLILYAGHCLSSTQYGTTGYV
jgi:hypothetical protein